MEHSVNRLPYWESLSEAEKNAVSQAAVIRKYDAGSILYGGAEAGTSCLGMVFVISGEIRAYIVSDEGREITLFRVGAGDGCILSASCLLSQISFDTQMIVSKAAEIMIVPSSVFGRLTEQNIYVRCYMLEVAAERFSAVVRVMESMIFKRFDQRLAGFLLSEYAKAGSTEIKMTQEQIAGNVNSAREVVARMLKQFSADGLIEVSRGRVILKDIQSLEKIKE